MHTNFMVMVDCREKQRAGHRRRDTGDFSVTRDGPCFMSGI